MDLLRQQEPHRGGAAQDRGLEVHQELALQVQVSRAGGHRHGADPLAPRLEAHAGRPQAVPDRDLDPIERRHAGHLVAAREEVGPVVHVLLGVAQDLPLAGGPRRRMDPDDLLVRDGSERKRIVVPEVVRGGQRKPGDVLQRADVVGTHPSGIQPCPVERRALSGVPHGPGEARQLVGAEGVLGGERGHEGQAAHVGLLQSDVGEAGGPQAALPGVVLRGRSQEGTAQLRMHQERLALPRADDAAVGEEVGRAGRRQRPGGILFHQQDGGPGARELVDDVEDLVGDQRRETQARLVQEQEPRPRHQGPPDGHHLLLAPGQRGGGLIADVPGAWETVGRPPRAGARVPPCPARWPARPGRGSPAR